MAEIIGVSARSFLIAGVSAAVVGAAAVTPVHSPPPAPATLVAAVQLASISSGIQGFVSGIDGIFTNLNAFGAGIQATVDHLLALPDGVQTSIKNAYDSVERWPAYTAAWAQFSLGLIPGLWWVAPSIPLAYNTAEPLARAGVYSFADMVGLDPVQAARDLSEGIQTSKENAATYRKAWADSFVAVPTLPPYPGPPPGSPAATSSPLAAAATAAEAPGAAAVTSGIENAIKNTYNAVEPWVAWGAELVQWGMGFVPGLWWLAPGVSFGYFTVEPLVQAGVFAFADVLGLDFAQIGPDVASGFQQSAQNAVAYGLAWLQSLVPFPPAPPFPPRPFAALTAPTASLRSAAAVTAAEPGTPAATENAVPGEPADSTSPATESATEAGTPDAEPATPSTEKPTDATEAGDPAVRDATPETATETATAVAETPAVTAPDAPTAAAAPAAGQAPAPSRGAHLGHRGPATGGAAKAARSGRSSQ